MNPISMWIKANMLWMQLGAIVLVLVAMFAYKHHYDENKRQEGRNEVTIQRDKQDEINNKAAGEEQTRRTGLADKKEEELKTKIAENESNAIQTEKDHETKLQAANARARAGNSGMQCPTSSQTASQIAGQPAREDSSAPGSVADSGGTDLLPDAAVVIQNTASDSARLVRDKNELVRLFNAARETCNAL
jgi:hypothetical protein